jgi:hypothetical protein
MTEQTGYEACYFALSNAIGRDQDNVPRLLRRLAKQLDLLPSEAEIQDLVMHIDVNEHGRWPSVTVYFTTS